VGRRGEGILYTLIYVAFSAETSISEVVADARLDGWLRQAK
jgi:hypothetical protein